eukprot:scaffold72452_cov31-Prasinocladus_malaysianus.AAC.1
MNGIANTIIYSNLSLKPTQLQNALSLKKMHIKLLRLRGERRRPGRKDTPIQAEPITVALKRNKCAYGQSSCSVSCVPCLC